MGRRGGKEGKKSPLRLPHSSQLEVWGRCSISG